MGFRTCVRHFLGAISMLLRPSLPQQQQQQQQQEQQEEKTTKIIIFYWFQNLRWAVLGRNFDDSPSFTAMVFSIREVSFPQQQQQQRGGKSS